MAIKDGIFGGWKLDETSGSTFFGQVSGGDLAATAATFGITGKVSFGAQFNGSTSFASLSGGTLASHNIGALENRTWAFWVNQSSPDTGTVIGKVNAITTPCWDISMTSLSGVKITCVFRDATAVKTSIWTPTFTADSEWHLVFVTFTRAVSGVQVYVPISSIGNMQLATLFSSSTTIDTSAFGAITNAFNLFVGKRGNNTNFLASKLDEIITWNRVLSISEMNEIHNMGAGIDTFSSADITSVAPSSGANNGSVSITNLAGTGMFWGSPTVKLKKSGQSDITATNVVQY